MELRIGLIGLDTSHAYAFTRIINDASYQFHIPGGRVVGAYPGGSPQFSLSANRVASLTDKLVQDFNLNIYESIPDLASQVDAILLLSSDGRHHLQEFEQCAAGKPIFIDKPFTCSTADARKLISISERTNTPWMSASSLRYAKGLAYPNIGSEKVIACEVFGPMPEFSDYPGLFWYGIHTVEMIYRLLGQGCQSLRCSTDEDHTLISARWDSGTSVVLRGLLTNNAYQFGWSLHTDKDVHFGKMFSEPPIYYQLMLAIFRFLQTGIASIDPEETFETIAFIEAAHRSRKSGQRERVEFLS